MTVNYSILNDLQLTALLREGDAAAFTEIYNRYVLMLLNHAYNKTRDREMAKDVVQEVFAKLWSVRSELRVNANLPGFLYTAVRNRILNQIAHQDVQDKYLDSILCFASRQQSVTDHLVREKQLTAFIEKEIAALPAKMRGVFELSRKCHLSHQQIAEKLDISEQTVSRHVSNALKILRVKLGLLAYLLWLIYFK